MSEPVPVPAPVPAPESDLDWAALALPDAAGEGARIARRLARTREGRWAGESALGPPRPGEPTLFDGAVALRHARPRCLLPRYTNGELDHPNLAIAEAEVARWPAGYALVRELIDTFNPILDAEVPRERWAEARGSSSHFDKRRFGLVFATYYDPRGLAQAFVHEAAHQKLFGLGVLVERADRIVVNDPERLYPSPIVLDRPRPMTAVLHGEYSFIHVTELLLRMIEAQAERGDDPRERLALRTFLERNVQRLTPGLETIREHIETDAAGERFVGAFVEWAEDVLRRGREWLERSPA